MYPVLIFAESIYTYQPIHLVLLVIWWAGIVGTRVIWDVGNRGLGGGKNRLRICIAVCTLVKMLWPR